MTFVLPALFVFATLFAIATISRAVARNIDVVADLRRQVRSSTFASDIVVTLREPLAAFGAVAEVRRPRQIRCAVPKPVTHRLHQFARVSGAA